MQWWRRRARTAATKFELREGGLRGSPFAARAEIPAKSESSGPPYTENFSELAEQVSKRSNMRLVTRPQRLRAVALKGSRDGMEFETREAVFCWSRT